jgi:hypothetical protein
MQPELTGALIDLTGLVAGTLIGLAFGAIQEAAARRYERLQNSGQLTSGWAVMPGSMSRTAYLLVALAAVQLLCPLLFRDGCQWWVSGGVVGGYGWSLWRKWRRSTSPTRTK